MNHDSDGGNAIKDEEPLRTLSLGQAVDIALTRAADEIDRLLKGPVDVGCVWCKTTLGKFARNSEEGSEVSKLHVESCESAPQFQMKKRIEELESENARMFEAVRDAGIHIQTCGWFDDKSERKRLIDRLSVAGTGVTHVPSELDLLKAKLDLTYFSGLDNTYSAKATNAVIVHLETELARQNGELRSALKTLQEWENENDKIEEANLAFRRLLFYGHGCEGKYGDDGEMQCNECHIDFKRDPVESIELRVQERGLQRLKESQ